MGVEVRKPLVEKARQLAREAGIEAQFRDVDDTVDLEASFDYVISLNCFEHYMDPGGVLEDMRRLLKPKGIALISFSPPWLHPCGGHLRPMSNFPWVHLLFPEQVVMRVRGEFFADGGSSYSKASGGINKMTIRRFIGVVGASPFRLRNLELVPIKKLRPLASLPFVREFFTSEVRAELVPRDCD